VKAVNANLFLVLLQLLFPHMRYTLQINIMARNQLISKDGSITMVCIWLTLTLTLTLTVTKVSVF